MFTGLTNQLDFGNHLIAEIVPQGHDLVKLKKILDWEKMNEIYKECYKSKKGNATKNTNLVLGLFILKHLYQRPFRVIINELHVNTAYMHFCSVSCDEITLLNKEDKKIIDHSSLVKIKSRLGADRFKQIVAIFTHQLINKGFIDGKYLYSDTTSLEKNILFPTDVSLLKRVIEEAEAVIQNVRYKKNMFNSEIIKKANAAAKVFYSNSKKTKKLAQSVCTNLIEIAEEVMKESARIAQLKSVQSKKYIIKRAEKLKKVGTNIIEQTRKHLADEKVKDRIISYYEDHARSLPKGKVGKPVEFGDKLRIVMSGNGYVTNWELYQGNPSDVTMLKDAIHTHDSVFGFDFKAAGFDRGFYDEEKIIEYENEFNILLAIPHKKDRTKQMGKRKDKIYNKRAAIEAKISEGKRMCGLKKSLYNGFEGDQIWTSMAILGLNIRKTLRDINKSPRLMKKFA
ncbi:MAG: transposase [Spirochaetes bacterium]|nr:transposase [Spirochaetota bacterium]